MHKRPSDPPDYVEVFFTLGCVAFFFLLAVAFAVLFSALSK